MQVKTFTAQNMERALAKVKKELGSEAIILSNRKVQVSAAESYIEVTAAADRNGAGEPAPAAPQNGNFDQLRDGIDEIKSFLSLLISSKDYLLNLQAGQPAAEIYHALVSRGLDEKQLYMLLHKTVSDLGGKAAEKRQILDVLCGHLLSGIKLSRPFKSLSRANGSAPVFTFLGPTGVGKTTTLAKLAAHLKIKRRLEIGIVSLDTYRIGAVDQLQTYAGILDIPFSVAQNKTEFDHARERFAHMDVILVDTTGRNFLNKEHVTHLRTVFDARAGHFLVLSATAKDEDLKRTILHFRDVPIQSLIFTKLDETVNHGCMINQILRFQHPLSYLGTGQRVPEDIEAASQKRLLSVLFSNTELAA